MIKRLKQRLKNQAGMTLVELLAVIVILGIVAAIAVPSVGGIIQKSKEDAVKADAIQVLNAAKLHVASTGVNLGNVTKVTLVSTDLTQYIEGLSPGFEITSVVVTPPTSSKDTVYEFNGSGTAGKKTVTFTGATLDEINSNDTNAIKIQ